MTTSNLSQRLHVPAASAVLVLASTMTANAQLSITKTSDSILDTSALIMPAGSTYGRAINGQSFQAKPLLSHDGYQYAAWYHKDETVTEKVFLARRSISGSTVGTWQVYDTGFNFVNGDANTWDAHNVISLGISKTNGTLHVAWDHHVNNLRYAVTKTGVTTGTTAWGSGMFNGGERNTLLGTSTGGPITYPMFFNTPSGDLQFAFRNGASNDGRLRLTTYANGAWAPYREVFGSTGTYSETYASGSSVTSDSRYGYPNEFTYGPDGKLHTTWVWRESNGANHDLNYAYSEDGGVTWRNNAGAVVADTANGDSLTLSDAGLVVQPLNLRQGLYNQQGQAVDSNGGVHTVVVHRRQEPGFEYRGTHTPWDPVRSAYHHYYRNPKTGEWSMHRLPVETGVGARATVGVDADGNVYAVYTDRGPEDGDYKYNPGNLVIAGATAASGYADWSVLHIEDIDFIGEPQLDASRLLQDGILSVYIQENTAVTSATGTPLHVIEFAVPEPGAAMLMLGGAAATLATRRTRRNVNGN